MNRRLFPIGLLWVAAISAPAAVAPIFINDSPLISPPAIATNINAQIWLNRSLYDITSLSGFNLPLPWESQNTSFFTNTASSLINGVPVGGVMIGDPGFRFLKNVNGQRFPMDAWVNEGTIITDHDTFFNSFGGAFFINDSSYSILQVAATNIISSGPLSSGAHGLVRLEGENISLIKSTLRTGRSASGFLGGGFTAVGASNYVNDIGVTDVYWAIGTNNTINNLGPAMRVDGPNFTLPNPSSPTHQVQQRATFGGTFTTITTIPNTFFIGTNVFAPGVGGYSAAVFTNSLSPTSSIVQVVFYPTNFADPNFTVDVRFSGALGFPGFEEAATVVVAFNSVDFDIVSQTTNVNSVYLVDAMGVNPRSFLGRNFTPPNTRRPGTFEVIRSAPFEYFFGTPGNAVFTPDLIYRPTYQFRAVTNRYAAYAAQIDILSTSASGSIPYDPTNMPGRIDIIGNEVDLDEVRIRAESAVNIKAGNLTSNRLARVDAPFVNFDGRSIHPELVISNLAPNNVRRMSGLIRAWSGNWRNFEAVQTGTNTTTNTVFFHVLVVDPQLQTVRPVLVNEFAARAETVVIRDVLNIGKSFLVEGTSLHITGGLNTPVGLNLSANNLVGLLNFTNEGTINVFGSQRFGTDRLFAYQNYVNRGSISGSAHFIRTENFENNGSIIANGGVFELEAGNAALVGSPLVEIPILFTNILGNIFTNFVTLQTGPRIQGVSEVRIAAENLILSNSIISAGTLFVDVVNQLTDFGPTALNTWNVTAGFRVNTLPVTSDLFGTHVTSQALGLARHEWAGQDFGATTAGFINNLALGKLVLNGTSNSVFRFFGSTGGNALYVDYLELQNSAVNINERLSIDPSLTIYFANANIPASRLDGAANGRIRWVPEFTGPLSSTNITYSSGITYTFNIALVTDQDLDSDADGIVNAFDPEPIPESVVLSASLTGASSRSVMLSWRALARSVNTVEFKPSTSATNWQVLTNFTHGQVATPVSVWDPIPTNGTARVYRLKIQPRL